MAICNFVHCTHRNKLEERPGLQGGVRRPPCQCWPSGNTLAPPCPLCRARAQGLSFASRDERFPPSHRPGATPALSTLDERLQHSSI